MHGSDGSEWHRPSNSAIPPLWSHVLVCLGKLIMYFEKGVYWCTNALH